MEEKKTEVEWRKEVVEKRVKWDCCIDCGFFGDYYMVTNEVWRQALPDYAEIKRKRKLEDPKNSTQLCIACVEKRLGRKMRIEDFITAPVNSGIFLGYKIAKEEK